MSYSARLVGAARTVLHNRDLRRVELAFLAFNSAEWAVWIAMLVYAYRHGGATAAGLVAAAQLIPAALVAPWAAGLAARRPAARMLELAYVLQATALGATAVALFAGGPPYLAYALAAVAATTVTLTRPTQSALVPSLVRTADELTATNVVSGWIESLSLFVAPAATGVLLAVGSPGLVFAVMAGLSFGGGVLLHSVAGLPPTVPEATDPAGSLDALRLVAREPEARLLVGLLGVESVAIGALDVAFVVLAVELLHIGGSGAGYLNAAFGLGGVVGVAATAALVGRAHMMGPLVVGAAAWGAAFLFLAVRPETLAAFLLLVLAGAGRTVVDVAGRTSLQRLAPADALTRVFGVLEGVGMAGLAVGSLLTPLLVAAAGGRAAVIGVGALLPLALLVSAHRLTAIDARATVPVVELALLRSLPLFAALSPPPLETLARRLEPVTAEPGDEVVREREPGDRFYVVADGELQVSAHGRSLSRLGRGDAFGEIALLRSSPRTATVTAQTPVHLFALAKDDFLAAVTSHPRLAAAAERVAADRLTAGGTVGAG